MNKIILKYLTIITIVIALFTNKTMAQCVVCVDAPPLITCGETVTLTGDGFITSLYSDNFNTGVGALWANISTGGVTNSNCTGGSSSSTSNCAGSGSVPAGDFLWFPPGAVVPRVARTNTVPVPTGGTIIFEFKMEQQSGSCDGPDLIGEGIMLQYNTGAGWTDMPAAFWPFNQNPMPYTNEAYFCPTNPNLQSLTSWNQYQIPIPAAAFGPNTQFRWIQTNPTSAQWDFWGLDNVNIIPSSATGASYSWTGGATASTQNITVSPLSQTNYTFTYSDGGLSCSTTVTVDVSPPVVVPAIVPNPSNPCPSSVDLSANCSFNNCNYKVYLYDNGGDGWITVPQTPTSIDNRLEVYIDGILQNTVTMNNGYGPVVYSFPVTTGGTFEAVFLSGGPNPSECAYIIEDNLGNVVEAWGLTSSPNIPFWPWTFPLPSPGFVITPSNSSIINTSCPITSPFSYSWQTFPGGSTAGITSPNSQNTAVTTASTQDYQVTATDLNNPGCVATGIIQVIGSGSGWSFDTFNPNPACEGCVDLTFTSPPSGSGVFDITIEMTDNTGTNQYSYQLNAAGNINATGLPINLCPVISAGSSNVTFNVLSFTDIADPNACEIPITNTPQVLTFSTIPNAGAPAIIDFCSNDLNTYDLSNYLGAADNGGTWTSAGMAPSLGLSFNFDPQTMNAGVYTYTVNNSPCPADFATVAVNLVSPPNAGVSTNQAYCANASIVDLSTLLGVSDPDGVWQDPNFNISNPPAGTSIFNYDPSADPSGSYTYTVSDPNGTCPDESASILININPVPTVGIGAVDTEICLGESTDLTFNLTGAANFNVSYSTGTPPLINEVLNAAGNNIFGNPISVNPLTTTNYTITSITDANGCVGAGGANIIVNVNNPPNAGINGNLNICSNDFNLYPLQNELGGGQDLTGYWTTPSMQILPNNPNYDYNPQTMPAGNYTYTVNSIECPDASAVVAVNLISPPFSGIGQNTSICINDYNILNMYDLNNMLIGADPGGVWTYNSNPIGSTIDPNSYGTGVFQFEYEVFGTPPCGNMQTQVNLTINAEPTIATFSSNVPTISQGNPISLDITMATGTAPFIINIQDDDTPVNTPTLTINPGMTGSVLATPNVIPITTYSITSITDGNGCTSNSNLQVQVTVDPYPLINPFIAIDTEICNDGTIPNIEMTLTQGEAPVTVEYTYGGVLYNEIIGNIGSIAPITVTIPLDLNNLNLGVNTISINSITDNSGATSPINLIPNPITVTINEVPSMTFTTSTPFICYEEPAILEFGMLSGQPPYSIDYTINLNATPPLNINGLGNQSYTIIPDPSVGINTYDIIQITDANGCIANTNLSTQIEVYATPVVDITVSGPNPICVGDISQLFFPITSGLAPFNISYLVDNVPSTSTVDAFGNILSTGTTLPILPNTTTNYTLVSVTDANGCSNNLNNSTQLVVNELPQVNASGTGQVCNGDLTYIFFDFTAGQGPWTVNYDVNSIPSNATLNNSVDSIIVPTNISSIYTYTLNSITDANCSTGVVDAVTITVNPLPEAEILGGGSVCANGGTIPVIIETTLGTPPFDAEYTIGINNKLASNIGFSHTINANESGIYTLNKVTDVNGCVAQNLSGSAAVNINPIPEANMTAYPQPADITNPLIYFVDQSTNHVKGSWFFDDGDSTTSNFGEITHTYLDIGTYNVSLVVETDSGCTDTVFKIINIDPAFILYVPKAFTPNNDLYNDYFLPIVEGVDEYELLIFDRLGEMVFSTTDTKQSWDGKVENSSEYATSGNYVYKISTQDVNGKKRVLEGMVTLIR